MKKTSDMAKMPVGTPQQMNLPSNFRKKGATAGKKKGKRGAKAMGGGY